jgi:predicted dehydrogenase
MEDEKRIGRRGFLKSAASSSLGLTGWSRQIVTGSPKYRVGLIGCGWWGMVNVHHLMATNKANVVALCDVDQNHLQLATREIEKMQGQTPRGFGDFRKMLEGEKLDIVVIATPDHWHALTTIAACEAGCDIYLEKPISHTVKEGRAMVDAARKHQRVVQVGMHRRSGVHYNSALEFLKAGSLGDVGMVRAYVHYIIPGQNLEDSNPPEGFDYDFWCGPSPIPPFNRMRFHGSWRHYRDYGNGQLGDWGVHWFDLMRMAMGVKYPKAVSSSGGIFVQKNTFDTPDTQVAIYDFDRFTAVWEHRTYDMDPSARSNVGLLFYGSRGILHIGWLDGWTFYPHERGKSSQHVSPVFSTPDAENVKEHMANFLSCVATRQLPAADILEGHYSTSLCLLGMVSLKLGRKIKWDGEKELILEDEEANRLLSRQYRAPWKYPEP